MSAHSPPARAISVDVARTLPDLLEVMAVRALVYMGEQKCPYEEEFDGNDYAGATHLIARAGMEPVGAMRMRWFADFGKVERVALRHEQRGREAAAALIEAACDLARRKGYRIILGHIQARLLPFWRRYGQVRPRPGRPRFVFSDHDYVEVIRRLDRPDNAISLETPAMVLLRPEGAWDEPGVLDRSVERAAPMAP